MKLLFLLSALFGASYSQFSSTAQSAIVKVHNDFRSSIALGNFKVQGVAQPAATNMMKMKWSKSLATAAQNFVNSCPTDQSDASGVGESMYYAWSAKKPASLDNYGKEAATNWQHEFEQNGLSSTLFDQNAVDSGIKEASKMVWAKTGYVGCGVKNCGPDPDRFDQAYKVIVVCRYNEIDSGETTLTKTSMSPAIPALLAQIITTNATMTQDFVFENF
ncbi:unnamed protein product [Caenorhabditis brenneri]